MNRKIKFRGQFNKGDWIYGSAVINKEDSYIVTEEGESFDVLKDTIGQYIGLKDKNNKEIYEGDIIKWYNNLYNHYIIAEVTWDEYDLSFSAKDIDGFYIDIPKYTKIEIIGNLYDNPNLLKRNNNEHRN